jgi:hypothetical protein
LGGTKEAQEKFIDQAGKERAGAQTRERQADTDSRKELNYQRQQESKAGQEYDADRQTASGSRGGYESAIGGIGSSAQNAMGIRNNALAQNQLTGSAESILAQRQAQMAGVPTIGQATDTGIAQNYKNAQTALGQSLGLQGRQMRGQAAGLGEGGALAMQQALASGGANAADLMAQNQAQQNQLASQMRFNAAMTQNQQDVDAANQAVDLRMGAAEQERQAALGFADSNAGMAYDAGLQGLNARGALMQQDAATRDTSGGRQLNMLGMRGDMTQNRASAAQQGVRDANQNQQFNLGTAAGIDQTNSANAYQNAMANSPMAKLTNIVGAHDAIKGSAPLSNLFGFGNK